jgi:2-methylcitrate dehydratase PrpD
MSSVLETIEDAAAAAEKPALAAFIGSWVAGLAWSDLPEDVRHWARVGIFDTIGVTLAGAREDAPVLAAAGLDLAQGPALVLGQRRRIGMLDASLINGTASHVLDFDDCSNTMGGHPSAPLVSAMAHARGSL